MSQREVNSRQQQFELYLKGIPQEDYPSDDIDHMILDAVMNQYQNAEVRSSLLMLNTELRDLRNEIRGNNILEGSIDFIPDSRLLDGLVLCSLPVVISQRPYRWKNRTFPALCSSMCCTKQTRV